LEVRVGNVETETGGRQVFGAVTRAETDITALIKRTLETVGRIDTTKVTAFTDGCPGLRAVLANAGVTKPPILDWFHIAMRLQHTTLAAANLSTDDADRLMAKHVPAQAGGNDRRRSRTSALAHLEGRGVAQAVARVACGG
jgi:hypothetical protein